MLSLDDKTLYQTAIEYKTNPADDILHITFAKDKDEPDRTAHQFIEVFQHGSPKEVGPWINVDVRIAKEISL